MARDYVNGSDSARLGVCMSTPACHTADGQNPA